MKSRVVLMALLCLLLIFTGVYAADPVPPTGNTLTYTGEPQALVNTEGASYPDFKYVYCSSPTGTTNWMSCGDIRATDSGTYVIDYIWSNNPNVASSEFKKTGSVTATINRAPVTVIWPDDSLRTVPYDGHTHGPKPTVTGILESDAENCKWEYDVPLTADVAGNQNRQVTISFSGEKCGNYDFSGVKPTYFTIKPAELSFVWDENKVKFPYDGEPHNAEVTTIQGCVEGESCEAFIKYSDAQIKAGNYTATATIDSTVSGASNYKIAANAQSTCEFSIEKAAVTLSWSEDELVYNGEEQRPTVTSISGITDADKAVCKLTVTGAKINAGEGTARASFEDTTCDENYTITNAEQPFTIGQKPLVINWDSDTFPYDGKLHPSATLTGVLPADGDILIIEGQESNAGENYTATASLSDNNYRFYGDQKVTQQFTITQAEGKFIEPASLENSSLVYTGSEQNLLKDLGSITAPEQGRWIFFVTYEGDSNSQYASKATTTKKFVHEMPTGKDVGTYTVGYYLYNNGNNNYPNFGSESNLKGNHKVEITKAQINNVTWMVDGAEQTSGSKTIAFDGNEHPITFKAVDSNGNDVTNKFELSIKKNGEAFSDAIIPAGTYTAEANIKAAESVNYTFTDDQPTSVFELKISPAKVVVTISGQKQEVPYIGSDYSVGYIVKSIQINGEDTTLYTESDFGPKEGATAVLVRKNVYNHFLELTPDLFEDYSGNSNLDVTFAIDPNNSTIYLTITPAELKLEWTGADSYVYNGQKQGKELVVTGCFPGDDEVCGSKVTVSGPGTENGKGVIANSNGNQYVVTAELDPEVTNYVLPEKKSASFTITPKPITITWKGTANDAGAFEMVYNGEWQQPEYEVPADAFVDACTLEVAGFSREVNGITAPAVASLTGGDYCEQDYTITNPEQPFVIVPFETTLTWTKQGPFVYNESNPQYPEATYLDYKGESVGASITIKDGQVGAEVGNYIAVASPQDNNHVFTGSNELPYEVTKHTLTLKPNTLSKAYGEDDPALRYNIFNMDRTDVTAEALEHMTSSMLTRESGEEVGEYAYSIDSIAFDAAYEKNYELVLDESIKFEITEGLNAMTVYANPLDLTYNGEEQTLIEAAKAKGGTVMYFLKGQTPSTELPKATDAGDYDIYYYVVGNGSYGDLGSQDAPRGPIKASIKKLTVMIIPDEGKTKVYGTEDPEFTYTLDPESPAPVLTGKLSREQGEVVSGYYIQQGTLKLDKDSEKNFELSFAGWIPFWITKATEGEITAPVAAEGLVYNGKAQNLLKTLAVPADKTATVVYQIGSATTEGNPNAKDAGSYEIEYFIKADANHEEIHNDSWKLTVSIAKAPLTAVPNKGQQKAYEADDPSVYYFHFDGLVNEEGNPEFTGGIKRVSGEEVGTYDYEQGSLALKEPANYELSFDAQGVTFEITKAEAKVTKRISAIPNLVFNGEPQTLIKAGKVEGGTLMYFIGDNEPSETLPAETNAGTYTVCCYVAGDESHNDLGSVDEPYDCVTNAAIAKARVKVTPDEGQYKIFGEKDPVFTYTYKPTTSVASVEPAFTGKLDRPAGEDVNTYGLLQGNLDLTPDSQENFVFNRVNDFSYGVEFEIREVEAEQESSPVAAKNLVYNGTVQNLLSRVGETADGEYVYILEAEDGYTGTIKNESPRAKDAMKYTIKYYIKGDENHSDKGSRDEPLGTLEVEIAKAPLTAVPNENQSKTFGDKDPKVYYFHFEGLVNGEENKDAKWSGAIVRDAGENVGFYGYEQGTLKLADDSNYVLTFDDQGVKFEITKAPAEVTWAPRKIDGLKYTGAAQDLLIPGEAEGGTILYFFDGQKPSEEIPQGTEAGDYPIYWYVKGDDNHSDLLPDNGSLRYRGLTATIARTRVKVTPDEGQFKYYDEKDPVFTYTYKPEVEVVVEPEFTGKLDRPTGEEIGFYNIMQGSLDLTSESKKNFVFNRDNDFTSGVQFEIRAIPAELVEEPVAATGLTYNGTAQNLLSRLGKASGGQMKYVLVGYGTMTDESPRAKDAMTYTIKYYIAGDSNHSDQGSEREPLGTLEVAIAKAPLKINPDAGQFKIVGESDPQLTYMRDRSTMFGDDNPIPSGALAREEGEDVGTYEITQGTLTLDETGVNKNYYIVVAEGVTFEIKPYQGLVEVVLQANNETREYTGQEITIPAYTIKTVSYPAYSNNDFTCTAMNISGKNVGEYTKDLSGEVSTICRNTSRNYITENVSFTFEGDKQAKLTIVKGKITEEDYTAPIAVEDATGVELVYNAQPQLLVVPGETSKGTFMYGLDPDVDTVTKTLEQTSFSPTLPAKTNAGGYLIYYYIDGGANYESVGSAEEPAGVLLSVIYPKEITEDMIEIENAYFDDSLHTANVSVTLNGVDMTGNYELSGETSGTEVGSYNVTVTGINNLTSSVTVAWRILEGLNRINMFRIGEPDKVCLRCGVLGGELPATGFPTRVNVPLAVKPEGLNYTNLNMRIQIPTLNVDVELEGVPTMDGAWKVEWLEDRAGLLSGTALPGDGYSIVAAHNTLNAEETGPFVLLSTMQNNDTIFVNAPDGSLRLFRVYANELLAPNDMEKLASIAEQESNTLVLVTCENESVDGGYLNRRVVFAKPLN